MTPQEAINRIKEFGLYHAIGDLPHSAYTVEAFEMAINALEQQEKSRWIPVTEKLPEEAALRYWVCTDTGYQCQCRWTNVNPIWVEFTTDWHWNIFDIPQYSKVIAWKQLPEPYEEETE